MVVSVPLGQCVEEIANGTELPHGIRLDILVDVLTWRLVVADSVLLGLTHDGVHRLLGYDCPLLAVLVAVFGLAAHHIPAKLIVLFQIGLNCIDHHLVVCHY